MSYWQELDFEGSIRDYEYTRRAAYELERIMFSKDFETKSVEEISKYINEKMEIVIFPDFLKRYIYEMADLGVPYKEVDDGMYQEIISNAFADNRAPFSIVPTTRRKSAIIKGWLTQVSVKRNGIFALGFGLKMPDEDVSMFLTKVLKESGFDFYDPEETIYWYCYRNGLPFAKAKELLDNYKTMQPIELKHNVWEAMSAAPTIYINSIQDLMRYLGMLKFLNIADQKQKTAYSEFVRLYDQSRAIIAGMHNQDAEYIDKKISTVQIAEITPGDLEKELCSGIPYNKDGNLEKMNRSRLAAVFEQKRMSRQRISSILAGQHAVERFDLITLLFFIFAQTVEPDWPAERYDCFIEEIDRILKRCHMVGIYPVNPYEAFILLCIISDSPLEDYAQIWENSYSA